MIRDALEFFKSLVVQGQAPVKVAVNQRDKVVLFDQANGEFVEYENDPPRVNRSVNNLASFKLAVYALADEIGASLAANVNVFVERPGTATAIVGSGHKAQTVELSLKERSYQWDDKNPVWQIRPGEEKQFFYDKKVTGIYFPEDFQATVSNLQFKDTGVSSTVNTVNASGMGKTLNSEVSAAGKSEIPPHVGVQFSNPFGNFFIDCVVYIDPVNKVVHVRASHTSAEGYRNAVNDHWLNEVTEAFSGAENVTVHLGDASLD